MKAYPHNKKSEAEWINTIPTHWACLKIDSLFSQRKTKVSDKDYAPLSVTKKGIVPQLADAAKSNDSDNRKLVRVGDFVINSRSDRKGSCGVSNLDGSVSLINIVLEPRKELNNKYIHYLLRSQPFSEEFYRYGRGIVADLWTTRYDEMKNILLPVPPRDEQDQIVRYLDWKVSGINRLINIKKEQIKLCEMCENIMINDAVLHGIKGAEQKDSGNKWIGNISQGWHIVSLGKFCSFQNGINESGDYFTGGTPFLGYGDVYRHFEIPEEVLGTARSTEQQQKIFSVQEGDIFFTRTSENIEEIGMAAVCKHSIKHAVFSGFLIRCRPRVNIVDMDYMKYYLQIPAIRNHFSSMMNIVIRASLSQNLLKQMPVVVPPINEQKEIAEYLDDQHAKYTKLIKTITEEIERLDEFKSTLISDVTTGKIDVRDVEIPEYEYVEEAADIDSEETDESEKVDEEV